MVLDDVQLKSSEFLSSQASRASDNFTFFSVIVKKTQVGLSREKLSTISDKSRPY